jgi:predicted enzyme related to lactoylglutathione lyase
MDTYKMADIAEGDDSISVAIYPKENEGSGPTNYINVESVSSYVGKIERAGGRVLHQFTVTGMGYGAIAMDPEGNLLGVWQRDRSASEA